LRGKTHTSADKLITLLKRR